MVYDGRAAAHYAESHAMAHSTRNCARFVRQAIARGGITLARTHYAKDYGRKLEAAGFYEVFGFPQRGDVVIIQPAPGHPEGHMAIYNGSIWISDFKQRSGPQGFYPGEDYRRAQPRYKIYRHE